MDTRIKICGITNPDDANAAVEAGVHALGFMFYRPSARCISHRRAREIIRELPPFVTSVAVLVNHSVEDTARLLDEVPVNLLQLHGDESPELCEAYGFPYFKVIRAGSVAEACCGIHRYPMARAIMFDTLVQGQYGGTGEPFEWQPLPATVRVPIILAGGLHPGNVASAIRTVRPYAVDVSTGVEIDKRTKDTSKMRQFVDAVRNVDTDPTVV